MNATFASMLVIIVYIFYSSAADQVVRQLLTLLIINLLLNHNHVNVLKYAMILIVSNHKIIADDVRNRKKGSIF